MGSTRSIFALAILAAGCSKEGGGSAAGGGDGKGGEAAMRVAIGDCAAPDVTFVSGPNPRPAIEATPSSGVLGMLGSAQGGAFASLTGTGDTSAPLDDTDIYGGLLGNEVGEMQGGFGFGRTNVGPGGGTGWGTIGTGRYGQIGHGSGTGSGYGTGSGRGGMRGRSAKVPEVRIGNATATGDLDKNIIRRYIRRQLPKVRYCYEKQLLTKPKLAGTVKASFVISAQGMVTESKAEGVDPEVSNCIASTIKNIQFPKPKGGGIVQVNYPFTFQPASGANEPESAPAGMLAVLGPGPDGDAADGDMTRRRPGGDLGKQIEDVRREGQYKMKSNDVDPQLAKQQAIEAARAAGVLGAIQEDPPPPASAIGGGGDQALGAGSPLRGHEAALGACFRKQKAAHGVAVVDLTYDAAGAVTAAQLHGVDGPDAATCVAEAARAMKRVAAEGTTQRCAVAFGTVAAADASGVDVTSDAILFRGNKLLDPASVMMDQSAPSKLAPLYDAALAKPDGAPVAVVGPTLIRPIDDARMKVVNRVHATLLMAEAYPVFAAKQGTGWRTLTDVELPVVPVPHGTGGMWHGRGKLRDPEQAIAAEPEPQLTVLVATDKVIWIGTTAGDMIKLEAAADQMAKVEKALRDHKASAVFSKRADIELAAEDEVTYGAVVAVIDAAARAGFTRWMLYDPASASVRFKQ